MAVGKARPHFPKDHAAEMSKRSIALSLKNVAITYRSGTSLFRKKRSIEALRDVSFDLYHGDSLGVIGRNGAGKSTLLRLLSGIIIPDRGELINFNVNTALLSLNVGMDQSVSGEQNAVMSGMLLGLTKRDIKAKLDEIFHFAELEDYRHEPIKNYSTGMKAKLGFSVATHLRADVLLIDEILSVGDTKFRRKSRQVMEEKLRSGDTVVLVSHNANDIKSLCNRAVWIDNGITRMAGEAGEVIEAYEACLEAED